MGIGRAENNIDVNVCDVNNEDFGLAALEGLFCGHFKFSYSNKKNPENLNITVTFFLSLSLARSFSHFIVCVRSLIMRKSCCVKINVANQIETFDRNTFFFFLHNY